MQAQKINIYKFMFMFMFTFTFTFMLTTGAFCMWTKDECKSNCSGGLLGNCSKKDKWGECFSNCKTTDLLQEIVKCAKLAYDKKVMTSSQCKAIQAQPHYD